ncbi:hypothetical protein K5D56_26785 [Pseudomonas cichorii]|nr:hypothetical protein [Pseudomonas cichorii]MBX8556965.1 hypothetical protein [Pseudomonas cichorii]MBX8592979.1 hypothetical protein [Pseudomonas cichorii]
MFSNEQVNYLFGLVDAVKAATEKDSEALRNLCGEVDRLKGRDQVLMLGTHEHKHGESHYLFLVPKNRGFGVDEFERHLQEAYEPEHDEFLRTDTMGAPVIID